MLGSKLLQLLYSGCSVVIALTIDIVNMVNMEPFAFDVVILCDNNLDFDELQPKRSSIHEK